MRILVEATAANEELRTGVGEYAFQLLRRLPVFLSSSDELILCTPFPLREHWGELPANVKPLVLSWSAPGWRTIRFGLAIHRTPYDVLFLPSSAPPPFAPRWNSTKHRVVSTVHDLGFLRTPEFYAPRDAKRQRRGFSAQCRSARTLLCVSEATRTDVLQTHRVKEDRVVVTCLGTDLSPAPPTEIARVQRMYRIGTHAFLYVSRLDEKKNVETLVRAFEIFKSTRGVGDPHELVLAGPDGYRAREIRARVASSPAISHIRVLGGIPTADKPALYGAAMACVNLSWCEGFGLSPLEAAACGRASILSDIPAHRETMGEAALYVPSAMAQEAARAMEILAVDIQRRQALEAAAQERVQQFSWDTTAKKTLETFYA